MEGTAGMSMCKIMHKQCCLHIFKGVTFFSCGLNVFGYENESCKGKKTVKHLRAQKKIVAEKKIKFDL